MRSWAHPVFLGVTIVIFGVSGSWAVASRTAARQASKTLTFSGSSTRVAAFTSTRIESSPHWVFGRRGRGLMPLSLPERSETAAPGALRDALLRASGKGTKQERSGSSEGRDTRQLPMGRYDRCSCQPPPSCLLLNLLALLHSLLTFPALNLTLRHVRLNQLRICTA